MPKNIMVLDAAGIVIGSTYEKRAKGLLKSGRAVLVDDHTIQLLSPPPNAAAPILKKEQNMEQEILFCAKAFYQTPETADANCSRLTATDIDGDEVELWELNGVPTTAAIDAVLQQKPSTPSVFRFALAGGLCADRSETIRCTVTTEQETKVYALEQNRYQPKDSRKLENGAPLRVYALPVETGVNGRVTIQIAATNTVVQVLPVQSDAVYATMPPYSVEDWNQAIAAMQKNVVNLANAKLPKSVLMQILANCGEHTDINLDNADVYNDME